MYLKNQGRPDHCFKPFEWSDDIVTMTSMYTGVVRDVMAVAHDIAFAGVRDTQRNSIEIGYRIHKLVGPPICSGTIDV